VASGSRFAQQFQRLAVGRIADPHLDRQVMQGRIEPDLDPPEGGGGFGGFGGGGGGGFGGGGASGSW
jgi:uncharacterized membrane protein YgcG